jgi:hypothetical protein
VACSCYGRCTTLITSRLPIEYRCNLIGDPTPAVAILDCLVRNGCRISDVDAERAPAESLVTGCAE